MKTFIQIVQLQLEVNRIRKFQLSKKGVRGYVINRLNNLSYY